MKFIAIAALVATASAADKKTYDACTKDDKCPTTDCCGTVTYVAADKLKTSSNVVLKKTDFKGDYCFTKDKTEFTKEYKDTDADKAKADDTFAPVDTKGKTVEGAFKCLATTGAASLSAAAAVLAASFYMA